MAVPEHLDGLRVGLSGAIPSRERSGDETRWSVRDIMGTVTRITQRVIGTGGRLLHGAHPTFVPLIEAAARSTPRPPGAPERPVELFVVVPFLTDPQLREYFDQRRHDDYAVVHRFGIPGGDRDKALDEMRHALIKSCDVLVCVGGELHVTGDRPPGVVVEMNLAREYGVPVAIAGAGGGAAGGLMGMTGLRGVAPTRTVADPGPAAETQRIMDEIMQVRRGGHG